MLTVKVSRARAHRAQREPNTGRVEPRAHACFQRKLAAFPSPACEHARWFIAGALGRDERRRERVSEDGVWVHLWTRTTGVGRRGASGSDGVRVRCARVSTLPVARRISVATASATCLIARRSAWRPNGLCRKWTRARSVRRRPLLLVFIVTPRGLAQSGASLFTTGPIFRVLCPRVV